MNTDATSGDREALNQEARAIYDRNGDWWDEKTGEGMRLA